MIIIQARMTSSRLPGKAMLEIANTPILNHVLRRVNKCDPDAGPLIVACTGQREDAVIAKAVHEANFEVWRGSEQDVLGRVYDAAMQHYANANDPVVRITADCPMVDPTVIDACLKMFWAGGFDYVSTSHPERTVPSGFDVEVCSYQALIWAHFMTLGYPAETRLHYREHVTPFMYGQSGMRCGTYRPKPAVDVNAYPKLSVDTQEDYERVKRIVEAAIAKYGENYTMYQALEIVRQG